MKKNKPTYRFVTAIQILLIRIIYLMYSILMLILTLVLFIPMLSRKYHIRIVFYLLGSIDKTKGIFKSKSNNLDNLYK
jgi:hypothetical protein